MGVCKLTHAISPISLSLMLLRPCFRLRRARTGKAEVEGSDPPLFPARCGRGGVAQFTSAPHPLGGSLPSKISLREAPGEESGRPVRTLPGVRSPHVVRDPGMTTGETCQWDPQVQVDLRRPLGRGGGPNPGRSELGTAGGGRRRGPLQAQPPVQGLADEAVGAGGGGPAVESQLDAVAACDEAAAEAQGAVSPASRNRGRTGGTYPPRPPSGARTPGGSPCRQ